MSSSHAAHAVSNIQTKPLTPILSLDEFRKRKSNERVEHAEKKKQQKPPKKVLIGIGLMSNTHARCPMEKSEGHWTFLLSNGSIELLIFHCTFECPFNPMHMEKSIGI